MTEGCLRVGQKAPDFTAEAVVDQEFKEVKLSAYKAKMAHSISLEKRIHPMAEEPMVLHVENSHMQDFL